MQHWTHMCKVLGSIPATLERRKKKNTKKDFKSFYTAIMFPRNMTFSLYICPENLILHRPPNLALQCANNYQKTASLQIGPIPNRIHGNIISTWLPSGFLGSLFGPTYGFCTCHTSSALASRMTVGLQSPKLQ